MAALPLIIVMIIQDLHVHTTYCDGKNSVEEMILSAIDKGIKTLGFSGHSYTEFDTSYCMSMEQTEEYVKEVRALGEKYKQYIRVLCGIELDVFSNIDVTQFDYVIGSAHYVKCNNEYVSVDTSAQLLKDAADKYFDGDMCLLACKYYETVSLLAEKKIDIIGHFDLVTKFNEDSAHFNESDPRYTAAADTALRTLIKIGKPFEINTGVIARGYRSAPYPSPTLLDKITSLGGSVVLNSDSHNAAMLGFEFEKWRDWANFHNVRWHEGLL